MALNASKIEGGGGTKFADPEVLQPGTYPARVVSIVSLGLQPQYAYKGEPKPPAHRLMVTYELVDEFLKDEDGNDDETKPRWLSEDFPLLSLNADLATSTKRYFSIDSANKFKGDWAKLAGAPCMVTLVVNAGKGKNEGRMFNNIASVQSMREKDVATCPELVNPSKVFDFDVPDLDTFLSLNSYVQGLITSGLEFEGSKLQALIKAHEGGSAPTPAKDMSEAPNSASDEAETTSNEEEVDW
jgi:hypothetical protein